LFSHVSKELEEFDKSVGEKEKCTSVPSHSDIRGEKQHSQKHISNLQKGRTLPWKMGRKVFPPLSDEEKCCCGSRNDRAHNQCTSRFNKSVVCGLKSGYPKIAFKIWLNDNQIDWKLGDYFFLLCPLTIIVPIIELNHVYAVHRRILLFYQRDFHKTIFN